MSCTLQFTTSTNLTSALLRPFPFILRLAAAAAASSPPPSLPEYVRVCVCVCASRFSGFPLNFICASLGSRVSLQHPLTHPAHAPFSPSYILYFYLVLTLAPHSFSLPLSLCTPLSLSVSVCLRSGLFSINFLVFLCFVFALFSFLQLDLPPPSLSLSTRAGPPVL